MLLLDTFIHWLHLMAAIIWVGGMIFAGPILTPVARQDIPPHIRYPFYRKIGKRFYIVGWIAILVLFLTGIYKLSLFWESTELFHSEFGIALLIKILLFLFMIALSFLHDFVWGPRLSDLATGGETRAAGDSFRENVESEEFHKTLARLSFWSRVNLVVVILIVFIGAFIRMNPS